MLHEDPEYPDEAEIVLVGNDCTFMSGSFGVKEMTSILLFHNMRDEEAFPACILLQTLALASACWELKPYFKVAWNDASNPSLVLNTFTYRQMTLPHSQVELNASEIVDGETRMKLDDIIDRSME